MKVQMLARADTHSTHKYLYSATIFFFSISYHPKLISEFEQQLRGPTQVFRARAKKRKSVSSAMPARPIEKVRGSVVRWRTSIRKRKYSWTIRTFRGLLLILAQP